MDKLEILKQLIESTRCLRAALSGEPVLTEAERWHLIALNMHVRGVVADAQDQLPQ